MLLRQPTYFTGAQKAGVCSMDDGCGVPLGSGQANQPYGSLS